MTQTDIEIIFENGFQNFWKWFSMGAGNSRGNDEGREREGFQGLAVIRWVMIETEMVLGRQPGKQGKGRVEEN